MGADQVIDAFERCPNRAGDSMHQWFSTKDELDGTVIWCACLYCGGQGRFTSRELERWSIEVGLRREASRRRTTRRGADGGR